MKKVIYSAIGAMIICSAISAFVISGQSHKNNEMLNLNVEALTGAEHTVGHCGEEDNDCIGICPGCGQLIEARYHKGPASDITPCKK